jgi:hypothetical protein
MSPYEEPTGPQHSRLAIKLREKYYYVEIVSRPKQSCFYLISGRSRLSRGCAWRPGSLNVT